ncbi:MAG: type II toxin-antitoxin system prevent-host-death family antitoxin [Chloroflexi bacterium]|nr:type II toxin-antitoxin system prevent-host-death family antitoxin [Chloroflexota bacterium]
METIGVYEAKTHLPQLLERVSRGDRITITKHGVPVAVLQPYDPDKQINVAAVIAELRDFRAQNRLEDLTIRGMIEEGRR